MISYPSAKINIGLNVVNKRKDGYHNIESIFYPIPLFDILEINFSETFAFTSSGLNISGDLESNLVVKAFNLLKSKHNIDNVAIHLHKQIPMGAGLGGGSSDAAYTLSMLNVLFNLKLSNNQLEAYAFELGSDCPFFIASSPKYITGVGDKMEEINVDLSNYYIYLINPGIHIGTKEAYSKIKPKSSNSDLKLDINYGVSEWKNNIKNDFESSIFYTHTDLINVKNKLYDTGALYASMSGSGSTFYGLFKNRPKKIEQYSYEHVLQL